MQSERISKTALSGMEKLNALALRAKNKKLPSRWVVKAAPDAMYKPFPLSDMQQAYWIGRDKDIGGGGVAMQSYVEIDCPALDVARLQRALDTLVSRHPMLRAVVLEDGRQQVLPLPRRLSVREENLQHLDAEAREQRLNDIAVEMIATVSDLSVWPQSEVRFSRLSPSGAGRLHFRFDQWAIDGRSFQIIFEELGTLYASPQTALPPLRITFRDYLTALEQSKNGVEYFESERYWKDRLKSLPPPPPLPRRSSPASPATPDMVTRRADILTEKETLALKSICAEMGLSHASALGAAYGEVLALWSGTRRFTLNTPRFNRELSWHPDINNIIGEFATFTLLEFDDAQGVSFRDKAAKFQEETWTSLRHGQVSGMSLLRELARIKGSAESASMPVVFTAMPDGASDGADLDEHIRAMGILHRLYGSTPQVHLDCVFSIFSGKLHIYWDSRDSQFPDGLIGDMFQEFMRLVRLLASQKEAWERPRLAELPETQKKARQTAAAAPEPLPDTDLLRLFSHQAWSHPENIAIFCGEDAVSYHALHDAVFRVSQQIQKMLCGVVARPEQLPPHGGCVAVLMRRGWKAVAAVLAVMAAGRPFLPLDASCPAARLETLVRIGGAVAVITDEPCSHAAENLRLPRLVFDSSSPEAGSDRHSPVHERQFLHAPHAAAYVMLTSGTTGTPKAVTIGQKGLMNAVLHSNRRFKVTREDRFLAITAMHHDMSMYDIFGALTAGAAIVILAPEKASDPRHWVETIMRRGASIWNSVPGFHSALMKHCRKQGIQLPLRLHILGGDWIPPGTLASIAEFCPGSELYSCGGPTETTLWNILHPVRGLDPEWPSIPYGAPIANNSYYIMDSALNELPDWVAGEMYCSGIGVCIHTTGGDENSFVAHPRTGERLYRTGDMGRYRPGGIIEILGRKDFQINIGGYRADPVEIESALTTCSGVVRALLLPVSMRADGSDGESRAVLGAWVETEGRRPLPEELSEFLQKSFPLAMIPRLWAIEDQTPMTANGKVDRKTVGRLLAEIAGKGSMKGKNVRRPAQTPLEKLVARQWAEVLDTEEPPLDANFFHSGGDSLRAMQVIGRIREVIPVPLPLSVFFISPTVEGVANAILERLAVEAPAQQAAQEA